MFLVHSLMFLDPKNGRPKLPDCNKLVGRYPNGWDIRCIKPLGHGGGCSWPARSGCSLERALENVANSRA